MRGKMAEEDIITEESEQPQGVCFDSITQAVVFFLGGQRYALPIERVQEIQQIVAFSEVPSGGRGVVGMVNLRGDVIPAVDLRSIVGMPAEEYTLETPMIICRVKDHLVAMVVDEVQDVVDLPAGCMQAASPMHGLSAKMLGVARLDDGLVYVLDVDSVVGDMTGGW